jgi:pre-mRNA-processing factor SLU7
MERSHEKSDQRTNIGLFCRGIYMGRHDEKGPKKDFPIIKDDYGNIVNPYIPRFIVKTPWYVAPKDGEQIDQSPLEHQKVRIEEATKTDIRDTEKSMFSPQMKKYRKGACENCGAITHKTGDCVERPKARSAKWTGIADGTEVFIVDADQSFDSKRDRWRGYKPEQYDEILESRKSELEKAEFSSGSEDIANESGDDLTDVTAVKATKQLRIREDTVKYLKDLKSGTSAYDPKTRSMRDMFDTSDSFTASNPKASSEQVFAWQGHKEKKNTSHPPVTRPDSHKDKSFVGNNTHDDHRYNY